MSRVCVYHTAPVICVLIVHLTAVGLADTLSILFPPIATLTLSTDPVTFPKGYQRGTNITQIRAMELGLFIFPHPPTKYL